jgi:hypothetical protein
MEVLNFILPVVGVITGWFLNETSNYIKGRNESKKPISRALSEILDIRHSVYGFSKSLYYFKNKFNIPDELWPIIRTIISDKYPVTIDISNRYNTAVDLISENEPILAYRLRSKDLITKLSSILNEINNKNDTDFETYKTLLEQNLLEQINPELERTALILAWKHSIITWIKIKLFLRKPVFDEERIEEIIEKTFSEIAVTIPIVKEIFNLKSRP